ncbi:MAG: shikimate dehydrogenase [Candidatus Omnitrophica bacterium]|nr:shikimate dehydrogenase [Candidatus Omnitrophota bacterium]
MKAEINGLTEIYALIGYPVEHTASCLMHNAAFAALKMNAKYVAFKVPPKSLKYAIEAVRALGIRGINVTIPHKEKCIRYLDYVDPQAKAIGAVNTVVNCNGRLKGYNSDADGFIDSLRLDAKFEPKGKNIFILGAGGASRAAAFALADNKAESITLVDIEDGKAKKLKLSLKPEFSKCRISAIPFAGKKRIEEAVMSSGLFINATGVGLKKTDPPVIEAKFLHSKLLVCDLIYNPPRTKLLKTAELRGLKVLNGEGLLLYQGMRAFKIWTGINPSERIMREALRQKQK